VAVGDISGRRARGDMDAGFGEGILSRLASG
jgi:hypothetical protein